MWSTYWVLAATIWINITHNSAMESYFTLLSIVHKDFFFCTRSIINYWYNTYQNNFETL